MLSALPFLPSSNDPSRDGDAIMVAVEESVSSTGLSHRGHGLAQMSDFVGRCKDGFLRIMSRNGEVVLTPRGKPLVRNHKVSIGGTLIEWNVTL